MVNCDDQISNLIVTGAPVSKFEEKDLIYLHLLESNERIMVLKNPLKQCLTYFLQKKTWYSGGGEVFWNTHDKTNTEHQEVIRVNV